MHQFLDNLNIFRINIYESRNIKYKGHAEFFPVVLALVDFFYSRNYENSMSLILYYVVNSINLVDQRLYLNNQNVIHYHWLFTDYSNNRNVDGNNTFLY